MVVRIKVLAVATAALMSTVVHAYDPRTHQGMSSMALMRSHKFHSEAMHWHLGMSVDANDSISDIRLPYPGNGRINYWTVDSAIGEGALREDDNTFVPFNLRSIRHFYEPLSGQPVLPGWATSPAWALEQESDGGQNASQEWSLSDAKDYLYQAFTASDVESAGTHFYRAFKALGHSIHHVQDMAQPQHVRQDLHCDTLVCEVLSLPYEPSFYEWLSAHMGAGGFVGGNGSTVIGPSNPGDYPNVNLYWERHYWTHPSGYGVADYSNRSFVTEDTNYLLDGQGNFVTGEFVSPGVAGWQEEHIDGSTMVGRDGHLLSGNLYLIKAPVSDSYLGTGPETSLFTSSYSMFAQDIRDAIDEGVPAELFDERNYFYLNRFNMESANNHLYQRAVGYSTGFIDHVFRGRLEAAPPEGNIYALIDHAVTKDVDGAVPEGFTSIKLKLRNATQPQTSPDSLVASDGHVIKEGKLVAVALYRPNVCYTPDLRGELDEDHYIANGCAAGEWLRTDQYRAVSAEIDLPSGIDSAQFTDFEFDFSANPIPVNARDLSIQLVFRGRIGGDEDAFAVVRKDISEPTWLGGLNSTDYLGVDGEFRLATQFLESPEAAERGIVSDAQKASYAPQRIENVLYANQLTGERLTDWVPLDLRKYHRLAVLAEPEELLEIRISVFFQTWIRESIVRFSPVRTWLEEDIQVISIPGVGELRRTTHQWYYTAIQQLRGIPSRTLRPLHLNLGTYPDLEAERQLPALPSIGAPEPIPLH